MQIDDFIDLMKKRRGIRRFRPGPPIPDEHINKIMEAAAPGYASQWSTMVRIWHEAMKEILDIPIVRDVMVVIPIGYPDYKPKSVYHRELKNMVHYKKCDRTREENGEDIVK